jgi:hypothetical protein
MAPASDAIVLPFGTFDKAKPSQLIAQERAIWNDRGKSPLWQGIGVPKSPIMRQVLLAVKIRV